MKSYTDLEQSKKLAEILPIESADMWFHPYPNDEDWYEVPNVGNAETKYNQLPCWSLSALLGLLPSGITFMQKTDGKYHACIEMENDDLKEEAKGEFGSIIHSCVGSDILDVVFDLMIWYSTNKKV